MQLEEQDENIENENY